MDNYWNRDNCSIPQELRWQVPVNQDPHAVYPGYDNACCKQLKVPLWDNYWNPDNCCIPEKLRWTVPVNEDPHDVFVEYDNACCKQVKVPLWDMIKDEDRSEASAPHDCSMEGLEERRCRVKVDLFSAHPDQSGQETTINRREVDRANYEITVEEREVVSATATPEEPGKDKSPKLKESGTTEAGNGRYSHRQQESYGSRRDSTTKHHNRSRNQREEIPGRNWRPRVVNELDVAFARYRASRTKNKYSCDMRDDVQGLEGRRQSDADRHNGRRDRLDCVRASCRAPDDRREETGRRSHGDHERRGRHHVERKRNHKRDEKEREGRNIEWQRPGESK